MALTKTDLATIAELVGGIVDAKVGTAQPQPEPKATTKRTLPATGKAAKAAQQDVTTDGPISFRAVVSDYMLREGQGHRYSARWVAVSTDANGKETVLKSQTVAVLDALTQEGVTDKIRAMVDAANKAAKLGSYAPQPA